MTKVRGYNWISRAADLSRMQTNRGSAAMSGVRFSCHRGEIYLFAIVANLGLSSVSGPGRLVRSGLNKVWPAKARPGRWPSASPKGWRESSGPWRCNCPRRW
jgi:hypothetical protein